MGAATAQEEKKAKFSELPDEKTLAKAGEIKIKDQNGQEIEFKALYADKPEGQKQLIVFIRHFMCGFCEEYIRALTRDVPPAVLATVNTTLTIIGNGDPSHIADYKKRTECPYEIYANPDRKLYDQLGMIRRLRQGESTPGYLSKSVFGVVASSIVTGLSLGPAKAWTVGKISQNGGEWLFENGQLKWCKRMRDSTDHAETSELKTVVGL